jgi:hypothetical protein
MSYLQLADNYLAQKPNDLYIFIPQGFRGAESDSYVREDIFDNLAPMDYQQLMYELNPYQNKGISELSDRASRKAAREEKKKTKGGAARREARAARQKTRQDAKTERSKSGGGFLDKIGGIAGKILNKDASIDVGGATVEYDAPNEESFFSKYKTPLLIGGGLVAVGTIYMLTKKKK